LDNAVLGSPRVSVARADLETEVFVKSARSIEVICGEDEVVEGAGHSDKSLTKNYMVLYTIIKQLLER
jgi:hypothetical protein